MLKKTARIFAVICCLSTSGIPGFAAEAEAKPLRIGMIGLDTSHVPAFAKTINSPTATGDLTGMQVVAGYPGGTDLPASKDRVEGYTEQLRSMCIEIVDSIPDLLKLVDVVMIESVDGRTHLEEARLVIEAGKPLFIDKPIAASLAETIFIFDLAKKHGVPCFSSSSLRFGKGIAEAHDKAKVGDIVGCATWSPCKIQPGLPDLFFYGIHGVEALYAILGPGCETVTSAHTTDTDMVTGVWKDGRVGTFRGLRKNKTDYGALVYGTKSIVQVKPYTGYDSLVLEVARFFKTGKPPVSPEETIEIIAFLEAVDESKRKGGAPVSLPSIIKKAEVEAASILKDK